MNTQHLLSSAVLAASVFFAGCGAKAGSNAGSKLADATATAVPTTIDKKLFYNFSVKPYAGVRKTVNDVNFYSDLANDNGTNKNEWGIWVERGHTEGFDHGHWFLNLETGALEEYFVHSGGGTFLAAPSKGGDVITYLKLLDRMKEALITTGVPQDAIDYVTKVSDSIKATTPVAAHWVGYLQPYLTANVDYIANSQVDILVDAFRTAPGSYGRSANDVWFSKGRTTVPAGFGTATITFDQNNTDVEHTCFDVKVLPVGADYTHSLASSTFCFMGGDVK